MTDPQTTSTSPTSPAAPRWSARLALLGAGAVHALALIAAFPPFSLWICVFIAMAALGVAVGQARRGERPFRIALWAGIGTVPFWATSHAWIINVSALGLIPLIAILSAYSALGIWVMARLARAFPRLPLALVLPVGWTAVEFFRSDLLFHGYAWGMTGLPLIDAPFLATPATVFGVYIGGSIAAAVGGALLDLLGQFQARGKLRGVNWGGPRRIGAATVIAAVAALCTISWILRPPLPDAAPLAVAILQTNVPQSNKIDWTIDDEVREWQRFESLLAESLAGKRTDLILWPETMMPGPTLSPAALNALRDEKIYYNLSTINQDGVTRLDATAFADRLLFVQRELGAPMLVGEVGIDGLRIIRGENGSIDLEQDARYNSVFLITSGRISETRYDKVRLTPFGEEMPYISNWDWLERQLLGLGAPGMAFDLSKGRRLTVFDIPADSGTVRAVTPICFEVTETGLCRAMVMSRDGRRADLFANVTNDGWFTWSDMTRLQHLQFCRWRALETATPMIRAANTGISAVIDTRGNVIAIGVDGSTQTAHTDGVLTASVIPAGPVTIYGRIGPVYPWTILTLAAAGLLWSFARTRRPSSQEPRP